MPKIKGIGQSNRTPFKHALLDKIVGKANGVINSEPWLSKKTFYIDLCAGDGTSEADGEPSPSILLKHAVWAQRNGQYSEVHLVEKNKGRYEKLIEQYDFSGADIYHIDASDFILPLNKSDNVIIHIDPNSAATIPDPSAWGRLLTERAIVVMTLGCNTAGLMRLPRIDREQWFQYPGKILERLPNRFDVVGIALNDAAKWTYLIAFPKVWGKSIGSVISKTALNKLPPQFHPIRTVSYRYDKAEFNDFFMRQFLTTAEYEATHDRARTNPTREISVSAFGEA